MSNRTGCTEPESTEMKTGCSEPEARHIVCPAMIRYAPPIGEGNAHQCPWCGGKIIPEYQVGECELCGLPYTTKRRE